MSLPSDIRCCKTTVSQCSNPRYKAVWKVTSFANRVISNIKVCTALVPSKSRVLTSTMWLSFHNENKCASGDDPGFPIGGALALLRWAPSSDKTNRTQLFCFYTHFCQKASASEVGAPSPNGLAPSPTENPGSATVKVLSNKSWLLLVLII